ncbi:hypothetical protein AKO1_015231 [Acrasis kona]|uniref:RNA polymerase II subunit B1 CTD phosphatase RPAP2 homolog n=1 Tax=Acrasis kona TaxID=1008807 RepID=A0AAW2ZGA0_9EUKA
MNNKDALMLHQKLCEHGVDKVVLSLINPNFYNKIVSHTDTANDACVSKKFQDYVCQILEPKHVYQIIEERNLAHLCGSPTCPNKLDEEVVLKAEHEKATRGRYKIDLKNRMVYDRSDEPIYLFCSNDCKSTAITTAEKCHTTAPYTRDCYDLLVMLFPNLKEKILELKKKIYSVSDDEKNASNDVKSHPKPKQSFKRPGVTKKKVSKPSDANPPPGTPLALTVKEHSNPAPKKVKFEDNNSMEVDGYTPKQPEDKPNEAEAVEKDEDEDEDESMIPHPGLSIFMSDEEPIELETPTFVLIYTLFSNWVTGRTLVYMNKDSIKPNNEVNNQDQQNQNTTNTDNDEYDQRTMKMYEDMYKEQNIDISDDVSQLKFKSKYNHEEDVKLDHLIIEDETLRKSLLRYGLEDDISFDEGNVERLNLTRNCINQYLTSTCSSLKCVNLSMISKTVDELIHPRYLLWGFCIGRSSFLSFYEHCRTLISRI